jgi:hypothetical protein
MIILDDNHIYRNEKREVYISVTQHLTIAGLQDFSMVRKEDLDHAAERGKHVHDACKLYAYDDLDVDSLDPAYKGYVEGYILFCNEHDFVIHQSEEIVYSDRLRTAGTFDIKGTLDGKPMSADIKTSAIVSPTTGLQLAGYQLLDNKGFSHRYCIHLLPNGKYKPIPYTDPRDKQIFQSICHVNWHALATLRTIPVGAKSDPKVYELCREIVGK